MGNKRVIILTGTIDPGCFSINDKKMNVQLTNSEDRLNQYKKAIRYYIEESVFSDIIFIENSGYDFYTEELDRAAIQFGKNFEFIRQNLTEKQKSSMLSRGKSYGESLLIDYAIRNSKLACNCDEVWKATGRLYIKNINKIVKHSIKGTNEAICNNSRRFIHYKDNWPGKWIHTELFKINKDDYLKYFSNNWELCDDYKDSVGWRSMHSIEQVWYQIAYDNHLCFKNFYEYPYIQGINGSSNMKYNDSLIRIFYKSILCKVGFYSLHHGL